MTEPGNGSVVRAGGEAWIIALSFADATDRFESALLNARSTWRVPLLGGGTAVLAVKAITAVETSREE